MKCSDGIYLYIYIYIYLYVSFIPQHEIAESDLIEPVTEIENDCVKENIIFRAAECIVDYPCYTFPATILL